MSIPITDDILSTINLVSHIDNTPVGIIVWNKNNQILFWSQRATKIFGWQPDEVVNKMIPELNLIHMEDLDQVKDHINAIINAEVSFNKSVNRNYTKSGKEIYCEWYNSALKDELGNISSILSLVQNITERKNEELALENRQQQLSLIYNSAIDPMWLLDLEGKDQFRFVNINSSFTTVTGLPKEQVLGKLMEEVLPPSSHEIVRKKYNEAIETGNVIDYIEIAVHPAGRKVGEIRVIPVKDINGKVIKLVGIANDITARSNAEEELNKLNRRLRDLTARLQDVIEEERAEIAREIHDELGQQLTAIKMDISWVARKGQIKDEAIYQRLTSAMELLDITVKTVRRIAMDLRPSILDDLGLQEALIWFAKEFEHRSGIACHVVINNKKIKVAPTIAISLFRVFQESLTNIRRHSQASKVLTELLISKQTISLKVTDNGQGFAIKQTSDKKTLGLLGMEERINKLKGHFEILSTPGIGTTVLATLPNTVAEKMN